jgi:hypothetical protein
MRHREADLHICELILDISPVHVMASVRMHAQLLGFNVHFIASGWTDHYQPLDRSVLGANKSTGRADDLRLMRAAPSRKISKEDAVRISRTSWCKRSCAALEAAWSVNDGDQVVTALSEAEERHSSKRRPKSPIISRSKASECSRHRGFALAAIAALSRVERPRVSLAIIVKRTWALRAPARYHDFGN